MFRLIDKCSPSTTTRPYGLIYIYKRLFQINSVVAHSAEGDAMMLFRCVVATRYAFVRMADLKAVNFNKTSLKWNFFTIPLQTWCKLFHWFIFKCILNKWCLVYENNVWFCFLQDSIEIASKHSYFTHMIKGNFRISMLYFASAQSMENHFFTLPIL